MNVKLWAGVAAVMLVLTCTGWFMSSNTTDDDSIVIVSRVNTDGSGIFASPDISIDMTGETWKAENWGGKVFATPGPTSIQHMMLQDLVENTFNMDFSIVPTSGNKDSGTVYWVQLGPGAMKESFHVATGNARIDGGIIWEPVFSDVLDKPAGGRDVHTVVTTHDMDPGHACCVLGVNDEYLKSHGEDVVRFLVAYIEVVDWMNKALSYKGSEVPEELEQYDQLVKYAMDFSGKSKSVVLASFEEVVYKYDGLDTLKDEIVDMVGVYTKTGLVNNTVGDLGFSTDKEFAEWLVNDEYLTKAMASTTDYTNAKPITIKLAHLSEDIHQLALYVGGSKALGTFANYKITIDALSPFMAGGAVAQAIVRGDADIGFLGAPPVVQTTINMGR